MVDERGGPWKASVIVDGRPDLSGIIQDHR